MIKINKLAGRWQSFIIGTVGLIGTLVTGGNEAVFAQVIPDDTLGAESSVVNPDAIIRDILSNRIEGGATRGANLFHSFIEFNVAEGRGVYFANPDGIENILSRVTGDNVSNILGRLGVLGEANLFLLNPNGILFGENASLDIEGSFIATTASGIELGEDGVFSATQPRSSRLLSVSPGALFYNAVEAAGGKITNRGNLTTGRNLTLDGENLDLQGQLRSGSDLTLFAQDTVKVRDSVATPFSAQAGGNLTIQGNGGIDIWALNHPTQTPFVSGGDLSLRSDGIISGDARFASGGSFLIQSVSGGLANFVSLNDPIISATGNVDVAANYTGASLLVEATGNIRFGGDINITGPDDTNVLPPGPDTETLSTRTALIMRSGQDTLAYGGVNSGSAPDYSTTDVPEGITIDGDVVLQPFNGVGGIVELTAASGDVNTQLISTNGQQVRNFNNDAQGGAISIAANGSIKTGDLFSYSFSPLGNAGNGGDIRLSAANGSIDTGSLISDSRSEKTGNAEDGGDISLSAANDITITGGLFSYSFSNSGNAGNGGDINLSAANDITITGGLDSYSRSNSGDAGNGGTISLSATNGNISTNTLNSRSRSVSSGNTGNGGTIRLESGDGIHIRSSLFSDSWSNSGNAGNGGDISLSAANDITITGSLFSDSWSDSGNAGNGGTISLSATNGNISTNTLNSRSRSVSSGSTGNGGDISLSAANGITITGGLFSYSRSNSGDAGNGGAISLTAANDINITGNLFSYSWSPDSGNTEKGGAITLNTTNGSINTRSLNSVSLSNSGDAGNGGDINLSAANDITITGGLDSYSWSVDSNAGNGGDISLSASDDITITGGLFSYSRSNSGDAGNGGAISLTAANDINITGNLFSYSFSPDSGNTEKGGAITLNATNGSINTGNLESVSRSNSGRAGQGGAITLSAAKGGISTGYLYSHSYSFLSNNTNTDNGGAISLTAANGINITGNLFSYSLSNSGDAGNGGTIRLESGDGIHIRGLLFSDSWSNEGNAANGGDIRLSAANGNISTNTLSSRSLSVSSGNTGNGGTIRLESGDGIHIRGSLFSDSWSNEGNAGHGGDISLSAANDITIDDHAYAYSLSDDEGAAANGGTISLVTANGSINTRNLSSDSRSNSDSSANGGAINLSATNGSINTGNLLSASNSGSGSAGNGGLITLFANSNITTGEIDSQTEGAGNGGNVTLTSTAGEIDTTKGDVTSQIRDGSGGTGNAGTIIFTARGDIRTANLNASAESGNGSLIQLTSTNGTIDTTEGDLATDSRSGNAGDIQLDAFGDIIPGEIISTIDSSDPFARGGDITIVSENGVVRVENNHTIRSRTYGAGKGGDINIEAQSIFISNNSRLSTTTFGQGDAGSVNIVAYDTVTVDNDSRVFSQVNTQGEGDGGSINITTGSLSVNTGAFLSAPTFGQGNAGSVNINARDTVSFDDGKVFSSVAQGAVGQGGDINITTRSLSLTNDAELFIATSGRGNGGSISIEADQLSLSSNAALIGDVSPGGEGRGGDINLEVKGTLSLTGGETAPTGESTRITLGVLTGGTGSGGELNIRAGSLVLTDGALIKNSTQGQGNAGNIYVNADVVNISGSVPSSGLPSGLFTSTDTTFDAGDIVIDTQTFRIADGAALSARSKGDGQGGDITVNATSTFEATGGGQLITTTFGQGQAGNIFVNATDQITISGSDPNYANRIAKFPNPIDPFVANGITETGANSGLFANTETNSTGNGGDIEIVTTNFNLTDNAQISASTSGSGKGGNLTVTAPEAVTIRGNGQLSVETTGAGAAGNLTLDTQQLNISDSASISASTSSPNPSGVGGNLTINATESFNLTNQASLLAQSTGAAKAGNVTINTEQLTADNGSITTSATATSLGQGGNIDVNASQINLSGNTSGLFAQTQGVAPAGSLTLQPYNNRQTLTINLEDNPQISASTSGSGEGGSLSVTAPESITIRGQGQLSVETTGDGAAGDLTIDTKNLTITDGATISASTDSANPDGLGGSLTINATESFTLTNQARLLAQSTGVAPAGTITVDTGQLTANNGSIETSATQSAGGAITITASDIRLFGDSDIRTDVASGVGGGGNITLTADTILAFADSDILAFAQDGKGGDITFNTPVFFGFAYAPAPKGTDPDTLDHNDRVDINATGAVEGVITLPDDSAVRNSLTPLSTNQIDTDKLIAESCIARRHEPQRGSFFITGTGGIPFRPGDLYDTPYQTGTVRSIPSEGDGGDGEAGEESSSSTRRPWKIGDPIIEPTGIYRLANGKVIMSRLCGE